MNTFFSDLVMAVRLCRTPDSRRTVAAWALYGDVNKKIPNKGWLPPYTPTPPPFEIRQVKNKGRGMIATRDIQRDEIILNERPILMIPLRMPQYNPRDPWRDMEEIPLRMLYVLEQEDREKVVQLHNCKSLDNYGPLGGIFMTNAVSLFFPGSPVCDDYAALCLNISYINHSCLPNAAYDSDANEVLFTVRAKRDIAKGEEITLRYISTDDLNTAERQDRLRKKYSFTCDCKLCSNSRVSDERRKAILQAFQSGNDMLDLWNAHGHDRAGRTAEARRISMVVEALLRAMDEEGYEHYDGRKKVIDICIGLYAVLGDKRSFLKWVNRGLDSESMKGKDSDSKIVKELDGLLNDPTSHRLWDMLAIDMKSSGTS